MMRDQISFYLNGELRRLNNQPPTQTLLRYLREEELLCGTKEGCAEGDCGACTVMISSLGADGAVKREAINACIRFLPSLEGTCITTVDALADNGPHPVQTAMIDSNGSQCGFCTPGFVMSLFTAFRNKDLNALDEPNDLLAGNLCRCTGYGPILAAAYELGKTIQQTDQTKAESLEFEHLKALSHGELVKTEYAGSCAYLPATTDQLAQIYDENPEAVIVAGATDVGLWVTKQYRSLPVLIFINRIQELKSVSNAGNELTIGAGATCTDVFAKIAAYYPDFGELVRRFASVQIRNAATVGGNIANGSPIGDLPPALIALGASLVLRRGNKKRTIALEDFFINYGVQDRKPGEFVECIKVPLQAKPEQLRCYKLSKRFDQDISAVCGCFNIEIENGITQSAVIAFGGMAEIPKRARHVELALAGKPWNQQSIEQAMNSYPQDFAPLTDMRASADYRMNSAQNLLMKYFIETTAPRSETRLVGVGNAFV